jgi:carbon-monoxide dehydrogenase medium subunit
MPRGVLEIPTVNTAASVATDASGACTHARVAVGAVSFQPIVLEPAALCGRPIDIAAARAAVLEVGSAAQPMADVRGSVAYKRAMAVEFATRALLRAWQRTQGAGGAR